MRKAPLSAVLFAASMVVACGSLGASGSSGGAGAATKDVTVDVGIGEPITIEEGTAPKIAVFSANGNDWTNSFNDAFEDVAQELNVDLQIFDAQFDPQRQVDQIESAISGGEYNAFIVAPLSSALVCSAVSRDAPLEGILVVLTVNPACDRELEHWGTEYYTPGTLTQVEGENNVDYKIGWIDAVADRLEGEHTVLVVTGPESDAHGKATVAAVEEVLGAREDLDVLPVVYTDFTTPTALTKVQDALAANPDVDVVLSSYSDITRGAIQAISEVDRTGDIEVFDLGGSSASVSAIKAGDLELTVPFDPVGAARYSVQAVLDAFAGKKVPKLVDPFPDTIGGTVEDPVIIDASNVDSFESQF